MSRSSTEPVTLDSPAAVARFLGDRDILDAARTSVVELRGGVSGTVWRARDGRRAVVVKQAMTRLRVAREWTADAARTVTEGRALSLAAGVDAARVPGVVLLDEAANVLVIEAAPSPAPLWKTELLDGRVDVEVARALGAFLAGVHRATAIGTSNLDLAPFDQDEAFAQLRLRPYFESIAARDGDVGAVVMPPVRAMAERRACLVHGDVSPKNVLLLDAGPWLLDWEVSHLGDPAFDLAFLCAHLVLKAMHLPRHGVALRAAARVFLEAYADAGGVAGDDAHLCGLTGALLVARVDGDSPVEYLDSIGQRTVRALGLALASAPAASLHDALAGNARWDG